MDIYKTDANHGIILIGNTHNTRRGSQREEREREKEKELSYFIVMPAPSRSRRWWRSIGFRGAEVVL